MEASDCTPDVYFAVECKRSKTQLMRENWLEQAKRQGKEEDKPWLLVVRRHNEEPYAILPLSTLLDVMKPELKGDAE